MALLVCVVVMCLFLAQFAMFDVGNLIAALFVAAMALLIGWLERGERIGLEKGDCSFHRLAQLWLQMFRPARRPAAAITSGASSLGAGP